MTRRRGNQKQYIPKKNLQQRKKPKATSMLDKMIDNREFESLLNYEFDLQIADELRRSIKEIEDIRGNPVICYVANVIKPTTSPVSIVSRDGLPFNEMIAAIPSEKNEVDIVIVTPGGSASQIAQFVNTLRRRFEKVNFLILERAMSAGTIFAMSGDEIIMSKQSQIGPIDPQVPDRNGHFVPAQSILTLLEEINRKGKIALSRNQQPDWTDLQILRNIEPKEIGNAHNASNYSIQLVQDYLFSYKFKTWVNHSTNGNPVTDEEKRKRAIEIASLLCNHSLWKSHGHAITREEAWDICKLQITHPESIEGLDRAMRRMWALFYWLFENTSIAKIFISENYCILRNDTK